MKKKTKYALFAATTVISLSAIIIASSMATICSQKQISQNKIVEQINKQIEELNTDIQTLESNKNRVDALKKAIEKSKKSIDKYKQKFNKSNNEKNNEILESLAKFNTSIDNLESKINESEIRLKQNNNTIKDIVDKTKKTSDIAIEKLQSASKIDSQGLKEVIPELQKASEELKKAKQMAQDMDSKKHVDDLVLKAKEVEKAEQEVKNLIQTIKGLTTKQKNETYLNDLNKHIEILNEKINQFDNLNEELPTLELFVKDFEIKNIAAKGTHNFINSITETLPSEIMNANENLKDVIENSSQKIKELKAKINNIKSDIDNQLILLNQLQNNSESKINSTENFEILVEEFNQSNNRLSGEIQKLNNKISEFKYEKAIEKINKLIENEKSITIIALQKLKNDVLIHLSTADNLSNEQKQEFNAQVENATTPQQLSKIKKEISLSNSKEKVKKDTNDIFVLFNSEFKQNSLNEIENATNQEQVDKIAKQLNDLHNNKQDAKAKINNEFNHISDSQKDSYIQEIINANTVEKVNEILNNAQKLQDDKQEKHDKINKLDSLTNTDKQRLFQELIDSNSANKTPENTPQNVLDKAIKLNNTKKQSIQNIDSLNDLNNIEKEIFKSEINSEFDESKINQNIQKAVESDKIKNSIKQEINSLKNKNLSENEVNKFIDDVNNINLHNENSKQELESIKNNVQDINNKKQNLISQVYELESKSINKSELQKQIINANGKQEAQEIFDKAELEIAKEKAKNNINKLEGINNEKQNFLNKVDQAKNKQEVYNIVDEATKLSKNQSTAPNNNELKPNNPSNTNNINSKEITKNKIDTLEYLSQNEKQVYKTNIDNSNNEQDIESQLNNAQQNNENKQNTVENVKKLDLISADGKLHAEEYIKNNSTEDANSKYQQLSEINEQKLKIKSQIKKAKDIGDIDDNIKSELLTRLHNSDDQAAHQKIKDELAKHRETNNKLSKEIRAFKKVINKFAEINQQINYDELKKLNQKIIDNLNKNIDFYENELNNHVYSIQFVKDYSNKVKLANTTSIYYLNNLEKALELINKKSRNETINNKSWEEYYKNIISSYNSELMSISSENFDNFGIYSGNLAKLQNSANSPIKQIARELFKNEIIHLVGNGIWSIYNENIEHKGKSGYKTKVAKIYFEPGSKPEQPKIIIDDSYYREKYDKFEIQWYGNPTWHSSIGIQKENSYDYFSDGLIFASNDEFGTKFKIRINGKEELYIENIPNKDEYMTKYSSGNIEKDTNTTHHIKPEHLEFISN
ncbi:GA module-containing protein [Mycoplasma sp. 1331]|uniref:GA module-containing protein n=2 Tax=Mycoplasma tauri TaxID=547987 RepID=A0A953NEI1_9MOLU|nr:GA module-containing protein [Mycoplasma tauri]MBZ4195473.1 GA module-containing protein [Mycoplasma tauri]